MVAGVVAVTAVFSVGVAGASSGFLLQAVKTSAVIQSEASNVFFISHPHWLNSGIKPSANYLN